MRGTLDAAREKEELHKNKGIRLDTNTVGTKVELPHNDKENKIDSSNEEVNSSLNIVSPFLICDAETIADSYRDAKPFPHGVMENIFMDGFSGKRSFIFVSLFCFATTTFCEFITPPLTLVFFAPRKNKFCKKLSTI